MKKIIKSLALMAAAAVALVSCQQEIDNPGQEPEAGKFVYTFTLGAPETKAELGGDATNGYFPRWEEDDQLGVYTLSNAGITNNTAADIDREKDPVEFKVVTSYALDERSEVYAYFPYDANNSTEAEEDPSAVVLSIPASQTGSLNAMPMAAKPYAVTEPISIGTEPIADIKMRNLGSILNFNVYSTNEAYRSETVSSIAFTASTPLCGSFTYDITTAELANITGLEGTTVTVTNNITPGNDKASGNTVPMVVAPNATAGYTGTIVVTTNVATYTYTISSPIKIDRSIIKKVNVDLGSANAVRQEMDKVVTVTYNFNNRNQFPDGFPITNAAGAIEATNFVISGNNIVIKAQESYYIINSTTENCGLFFGKSVTDNSVPTDATSYLEFPAKPGYRIGKVVATTTGAVAGGVKVNIYDTQWNAESTQLTTTGSTSTEMPFSLTSSVVNTPYRLSAATTSKNLQFKSIVIKYYLGDYTPAADPLSTPMGLTSDHIEQTTARLSWNAVLGASSYTVKIGETEYPGINTSSYTATGLTPSTSYNWTVKAVGDGINYSDSDYASIESFTTADEEAGAFFYETFGVPTGNTNVTAFEGWSETSVTYSGSARVGITSSNICTINGSSAQGYMYITSATVNQFDVAGINTSKYDNIALSINYKGNNTSAKWKIEYSTNGTNYTIGASNISCTTTWKSYNLSTKLPSCENLRLRITNTATDYGVYFDDLKLFGDLKKQLTAIEVSGTPTKTTYIDGEAFDPAGLTVTANYDDGSSKVVTTGITWTDGDGNELTGLTAGTTSVTVKAVYKDVPSAEFTVTGLTVTAPAPKTNLDAPTGLTWTESSKTLSWTDPNTGKGTYNTNYKYQYSVNGGSSWSDATNSTTTVLSIASTTTVKVKAVAITTATHNSSTEVSKECTVAGGKLTYSFTIQTSDFNTTSYAANNGSHDFTATCTTDPTKTMTVAVTTNQIYQGSSKMQWQKTYGYLYNTTDLGTINSVVVNGIDGTFTTYYGTSANPTSGTTVGNGFFTVKNTKNGTSYCTSVVVTFTK